MIRKRMFEMFRPVSRTIVTGFVLAFSVMLIVSCSDESRDPLTPETSNVSANKSSDNVVTDTPPAEGSVVEGVSVPGIALGFTRAEVLISYGEPQWCQSSGDPGNKAFCSFPVEGGGQVDVHFRGADGGNANGTSDDVVFKISWSEAVNGWVTTAGITTSLAKENPEDVITAYPDAQVTYTQFGSIYSVIDYTRGIEVLWLPDFYTGQTHISMGIFYSSDPPPVPDKFTHVSSINLTSRKNRGKRLIQGSVKVQDELNQSVQGATVFAHWTFPDGSVQSVENVTTSTGNAQFNIKDVPRGTYTLTVDDVVREGYEFDDKSSVLSKSIFIR